MTDEALADGVFALAMTLLILDVKLPAVEPGQEADLPRKLAELGPRFLTCAIRFLITGLYWGRVPTSNTSSAVRTGRSCG
jgi:uncharacterized membrane protein